MILDMLITFNKTGDHKETGRYCRINRLIVTFYLIRKLLLQDPQGEIALTLFLLPVNFLFRLQLTMILIAIKNLSYKLKSIFFMEFLS